MKTPETQPAPARAPRRATRYTRDAAFDKRADRLEAWRDRFGLLRWCQAGTDPNK